MSSLHPGFLDWTPGEASAVNEFLNSPVGRKWLAVLLNRKPPVNLRSTEEAALTGAFSAGYESFFKEIAATRVGRTPAEDFSAKMIDSTKD